MQQQFLDLLFVFSWQAISFLTPLAVIFVVKIIQRTDKTEIKEACLGESRIPSQRQDAVPLWQKKVTKKRMGWRP